MSRTSQQVGQRAEEILKNTFDSQYEIFNIGHLQKIEGKTIKNKYSLREKLISDFAGDTIAYQDMKFKYAHPLYIECKATITNKFEYRNIKEHQARFLYLASERKALTFIILFFYQEGRIIKFTFNKNSYDNLMNSKKKYQFTGHFELGQKKSILGEFQEYSITNLNILDLSCAFIEKNFKEFHKKY